MREWQRLTSNPEVLDIVNGFKIPFVCKPQQSQVSLPLNFSSKDELKISNIISKLVKIGAICNATPSQDQFISRIFIVPKSDGGSRLVKNLKYLNEYVQESHFILEDYRTVCTLLSPDSYMATIDLQDVFHLIPLH